MYRCTKAYNKSIELYEYIINLNSSDSITLKSLHDICLIRIEEKDIYQAYHTLDRLETQPANVMYYVKCRKFVEGCLSMVKKKFREGVELLDSVVDDSDLHVQLRPLVYSYRAYGLFSEGELEKAMEDYRLLEKNNQMMECDRYNVLLVRGILSGREKKYQESKQFFTEAHNLQPNKIEPRFYLAVWWFNARY